MSQLTQLEYAETTFFFQFDNCGIANGHFRYSSKTVTPIIYYLLTDRICASVKFDFIMGDSYIFENINNHQTSSLHRYELLGAGQYH